MDTESDVQSVEPEPFDGLNALRDHVTSAYGVPPDEVELAVEETGASWAPVATHQWEYTFSQGGPKQRSLRTAADVLVKNILRRTFAAPAVDQEPAQSGFKEELDKFVQDAPDPSGTCPAEACASAIIQQATTRVVAQQDSLSTFHNIKDVLPLWSLPAKYFRHPQFCMWYFGILSLPDARMFEMSSSERDRVIRKLRSSIHPDKFPDDKKFYTDISQAVNSVLEEQESDGINNNFGNLPYTMSCPEMLHSCMVHRLGEDLAGANRTINDLRAQQSDTRRKLQGLQAAYAPSNEQDIQQLKASNTSLKRSIDTLVDNATEMYLNSKRMQRAAV